MVKKMLNKKKFEEDLQKFLELHNQKEGSSRIEILVDYNVFDKAEKMARVLNTDVESILSFAAYRLYK